MPYITKDRRSQLARPHLDHPQTPGELNYVLTMVCLGYLDSWLDHNDTDTLKYTQLNDIVGALEGAKMEFYRRIVAPFEEAKREKNGDVY